MEDVKSVPPKRGRPFVYSEDMRRGSFRLPVSTVTSLRKIGEGNVTRAIIRLVKMWEDNHS